MRLTAVFIFFLIATFDECAHADTFGSNANAFNIEFVPIGNRGDSADDISANPDFAGSVPYRYRIGKFEVSRDTVIKANNAGGLGVTLQDMSPLGGNGADRPATGVSWNEAARFVNWLNSSQGLHPAYKFATEPGAAGYNANQDISAWAPGDAGYDPNNLFRNRLARYVLPSVDEWYKAAFYDPFANGGAGGYWNYATGSNSPPTPVASGTLAGTAVYSQPGSQGPADVTLAGGLTPYGVMAMAGNVYEWEETVADLENNFGYEGRSVRGGQWNSPEGSLRASDRVAGVFATAQSQNIGFRVVSIPEPSALLLGAMAGFGLLRPTRPRR